MSEKMYKVQYLTGHAYLPPPPSPEREYQRIRVMGKPYIVPTGWWCMGMIKYRFDKS